MPGKGKEVTDEQAQVLRKDIEAIRTFYKNSATDNLLSAQEHERIALEVLDLSSSQITRASLLGAAIHWKQAALFYRSYGRISQNRAETLLEILDTIFPNKETKHDSNNKRPGENLQVEQ